MLPPFRAEDYSQNVHAQVYKCISENKLGKIQSRDVHVRAGKTQNLFPNLRGVYVSIPLKRRRII